MTGRRLSKREERRRQQYNDPDFYVGANVYDYCDDDSPDDDDSNGYDDRAAVSPRKSQLDRVKDLEAAFTSLPKSKSTTLAARIRDLEEVIKKPDNVGGVSTDDRIRALEEAYSGKSRSRGGRSVNAKLEEVEKELELNTTPNQLEDRVIAAEKAAGVIGRRRGRMGIPERVDRLYREVIGENQEN